MIPYDDLVLALQEWRALKGLPVAQLSGALTPPPVVAPPPVAAKPAAKPARAAAPQPPPRGGRPPAPVAAQDTLDEGALSLLDDAHLEEHLGANLDEGGNFSMQFDPRTASHEDHDESTSVGAVPPGRGGGGDMDATNPHGDPTLPRTAPNRNDDW